MYVCAYTYIYIYIYIDGCVGVSRLIKGNIEIMQKIKEKKTTKKTWKLGLRKDLCG